MPWSNTPGQRIPEPTRQRILRRDRRHCYLCGEPGATQVDHVTPRHRGGGDDDANLAAICEPCHKAKTQREAAAQRNTKARRRREPEPHPGVLHPGGGPPHPDHRRRTA